MAVSRKVNGFEKLSSFISIQPETPTKCQIGKQLQNTFINPNCYTNFAAAAAAKSLQSCPILCDPIDGSPPGSPVPGILQARTLEWVAISFSNGGK